MSNYISLNVLFWLTTASNNTGCTTFRATGEAAEIADELHARATQRTGAAVR